MNRSNFGMRSGVIIDVCRGHGTWFDRDELRRVIEFIRSGGLDLARQREIEQLREAKRRASPTGIISLSDEQRTDANVGDTGGDWVAAVVMIGVAAARAFLLKD
jgi:Zn-finger nucleic acid-binding protein